MNGREVYWLASQVRHPINYEGWVITLDSYNQNYTAIFTVSHGGSSSNLTMVIGMASTTFVGNGVYEIEIDYLSKFSNGAVISLITFVNNPPPPEVVKVLLKEYVA